MIFSTFSRLILLFGLTLLLGACITLKRPYQAEWSKPLNLKLHPESLVGTKIDIECSIEDEESQSFSGSCQSLATLLESVGATVVGTYTLDDQPYNKDKRGDLKIILVEYPSDSDYGGWTTTPCIFTFTFFPCIVDTKTKVSLILTQGTRRTKHDFHLSTRDIYGPLALILYVFNRQINKDFEKQQRLIPKKFVMSLINRIYSFEVSGKIGQGRYNL